MNTTFTSNLGVRPNMLYKS